MARIKTQTVCSARVTAIRILWQIGDDRAGTTDLKREYRQIHTVEWIEALSDDI